MCVCVFFSKQYKGKEKERNVFNLLKTIEKNILGSTMDITKKQRIEDF
jgi:hypothetical protein